MVVVVQAQKVTNLATQGCYAVAGPVAGGCLLALRTVVAFGGGASGCSGVRGRGGAGAPGGPQAHPLKTAAGLGIRTIAAATALYYGMTLVYDGATNGVTGEVWTAGEIFPAFLAVISGGVNTGHLDPMLKHLLDGRLAMARPQALRDAAAEIQCVAGEGTRKAQQRLKSSELQGVPVSYPARPEIQVLKGVSPVSQKGQ